MNIELIDIEKIKPYPNNPRINDQAVDAVAKSIQEFGFKQPVVVDSDMVLVVGHTRWKAAMKLGLKQLPTLIAKDLTPDQVRAYRIADNQTNTLAEWDDKLLLEEIQALSASQFDLGSLGFSDEQLAAITSQGVDVGIGDPDNVPAPPDAAITQKGDLWILGDHRLLCGDSSDPAQVDRLLDGAPIHLVNTDPPYNVKVEPRSNNAIAAGLSSFPSAGEMEARTGYRGTSARCGTLPSSLRSSSGAHHGGLTHHQSFDLARSKVAAHKTTDKLRPKDRQLANDFISDDDFNGMLDAWFGNISRVLLPGRGFYIWGGYANLGNYPPYLKKHELYFSQGIIWDKGWPVLTRKDFMGAFEIAFYGWHEGAAHKFYGPNNATDLWHVKKVTPMSMVHLTEKPVELATLAMQYSSLAEENVLDLFGGSGSTLIAAEQTHRHAFLMEMDEAYCDVIVERWEKFTGKKAQRVTASQKKKADVHKTTVEESVS